MKAARRHRQNLITVSGGVSCNSRLREAFTRRCEQEGVELRLAAPQHTTDNAAMIAFAAALQWQAGKSSPLTTDVDPNLAL